MTRAKRILIVEDDALLAETLIEQFALHDEFAVEALGTAEAAIAKVKEEAHIDLVLLDVGLPDMDGREACQLHAQGRLSVADHHADRRRRPMRTRSGG